MSEDKAVHPPMTLVYSEEYNIHVEQSVVWIVLEVPITVSSGTTPTTIYMKVKYISGQLGSKQAVDQWIERALSDIARSYTHFTIKSVNVTKRL
jgi:hypothetical protein